MPQRGSGWADLDADALAVATIQGAWLAVHGAHGVAAVGPARLCTLTEKYDVSHKLFQKLKKMQKLFSSIKLKIINSIPIRILKKYNYYNCY